ncbi:MAG: PTS sugar transporter subunit IIC, partial [Bacteroidaceae bacterium]|nr:PTS sugar transporter subunit IIC [Bacteroidaceae bacterium]
GNQFLPLASLAGMFYVFVMVLPYTNGNVVKSFIVGLVVIAVGLLFVTWMADNFTSAAQMVSAAHPDDQAVKVPEGFKAGSLDFASSPIAFLIYGCMKYLNYIGAGVLTVITIILLAWNRKQINKAN